MPEGEREEQTGRREEERKGNKWRFFFFLLYLINLASSVCPAWLHLPSVWHDGVSMIGWNAAWPVRPIKSFHRFRWNVLVLKVAAGEHCFNEKGEVEGAGLVEGQILMLLRMLRDEGLEKDMITAVQIHYAFTFPVTETETVADDTEIDQNAVLVLVKSTRAVTSIHIFKLLVQFKIYNPRSASGHLKYLAPVIQQRALTRTTSIMWNFTS